MFFVEIVRVRYIITQTHKQIVFRSYLTFLINLLILIFSLYLMVDMSCSKFKIDMSCSNFKIYNMTDIKVLQNCDHFSLLD